MSGLAARFRLGRLDVAALSDGIGEQRPDDWFPGVSAAEWMAAIGATDANRTLPVNFGSFLVRSPGQTTLIDTGNGPRTRGAHTGAAGLLDRMAELGVQPEDVDSVLLTHFHGDHVGWNTTEADGGPLTFPRARFWLHAADVRHLERPEGELSAGDRFSRGKLWPLRDAGRLETFEGEHSPVAGLTFLPAPGHTPGHCAVLVESASERLIIVGDAAPQPVHLEHPEWTPVFDLDGPQAVASRRALAARAVRDGALVTGGHFPILTLGQLEPAGAGEHRWVAV